MRVRCVAVFLAFVAAVPLTVLAGERKPIAAPFGEYRVVALRNASDVAAVAKPGAAAQWLNRRVSFGEGQLTWLEGQTCRLWSVRRADAPAVMLADPNLSDLAIPPLDSTSESSDRRVNMAVDLVCQDDGERVLARFVIIDARVLVQATAGATVNLILERPLTKDQIGKFQTQLKDMKFYGGTISGELDAATLQAVGSYVSYRGAAYRFYRPVITENLLDGLGVLD